MHNSALFDDSLDGGGDKIMSFGDHVVGVGSHDAGVTAKQTMFVRVVCNIQTHE